MIVRSENKEDENILSIRSITEIISTVESLDIVSESKIDDRNQIKTIIQYFVCDCNL